ncbi:MAG: Holliday junction branch migration protein RuvA [Clostridia bacterium]|nr:Holliday junction branch migration protein RuvA [Clostridia bacterium]
MIYSLKGILLTAESNFLVVECAGVGYKCLTSLYTQSAFSGKIGSEVMVYTYMNVRQDAVDLFGFSDKTELEYFKLLTSVSGVGPKAALAILSQFPADKLALLITSGDSKSLTAASGIGKKTAERIVLELKDKISKSGSATSGSPFTSIPVQGSNVSEAMKALATLGFSAADVTPILSSLSPETGVEEMINTALKSMAKKV